MNRRAAHTPAPSKVRPRLAGTIVLAVLAAALCSLAGWIITVNLYATWKAVERQEVVRSQAFHVAFWVAGPAGAVGFLLAFFWLRSRRPDSQA